MREIKIQLSDVWKSGYIYLKKTGETSFNHQILSTGSGTSVTFNISPSLSNFDNDEIRVANTGGRKHWWAPWSRSIRLRIWVDGVLVYNVKRSCRWCHSSGQVFTCHVNKFAEANKAVSCS